MRLPKTLLENLPDFRKWAASTPAGSFGLLDYVGCVATPDLVFAFGELFHPELVMHDGSHFIAERFGVAEYEAWTNRLQDPIQVQKVINHLHIATILQGHDLQDDVARAAADSIAAVWSRVFHREGLVGEAYGTSAEDVQVTLFKKTS